MEIGGTSSTDQKIIDQSHEVPLDINELANSLREQLKIEKAFSLACCIYRVPERLRKLNEKAYTPRVVSIGPIHHGKENLKAMEDHKIMYLQQFLEQNLLVSVEDLVYVIKENETALRDCYAETINLSRKDFARMILLDAVFIIMFLLKWKYMNSEEIRDFSGSGRSDQIFFPPWKLPDVKFDMCLLENQLPYFILEKLFNLSRVDEKCTFIELTGGLLESQCLEWVEEDSWETISSSEVLHFVDFLRKCQQPFPVKETASLSTPPATNKRRPPEQTLMLSGSAPTATIRHHPAVKISTSAPIATIRHHPAEQTSMLKGSAPIATIGHHPAEQIFTSAPIATIRHHPAERTKHQRLKVLLDAFLSAPTATELHQSGVKFNLSKERKLSGISFNKGILEIPQLEIHDNTEILFRNVQAFEQCHHLSTDTFVSDYITFMSCLVRAPNDVEVLAHNKILKNMLSSAEAVSNFFHDLNKENMVTTAGFLSYVCKDLELHCRRHTPKWKATLEQVYFKNPWTGISVFAASFLLVLTVIQTVCSILQL